MELKNLFEVFAIFTELVVGFETQDLKRLMLFMVGLLPKVGYQRVTIGIQVARGGNQRIKLADRTGRQIPRIGKRRQSFFHLPNIDARELFFGNNHFAARFDIGHRFLGKTRGNPIQSGFFQVADHLLRFP